MKRLSLALPVLAASIALTLSACGGGGGGTPTPDKSSLPSGAATMANPAAQYCVEQGGSVDASGICTLPDGTKVDEWELFRSAHPDQDSGSTDNDSDSDN